MEEGLDGGEDGCHVVSWAPAGGEDIKAEGAIGVDVWVENLADEADVWGFVGVVLIKVHGEFEDTILKRRFRRSKYCQVKLNTIDNYPRMTADHFMMLSGSGDALTPSGGSSCMLVQC